jgi:hypothetical protein
MIGLVTLLEDFDFQDSARAATLQELVSTKNPSDGREWTERRFDSENMMTANVLSQPMLHCEFLGHLTR